MRRRLYCALTQSKESISILTGAGIKTCTLDFAARLRILNLKWTWVSHQVDDRVVH